MRKIFLFALGLTFILSACKKDIDTFIPNVIDNPTPPQTIVSDIGGTIVDEANEPVANVTIEIGTATTTTDERGIFLVKNVMVPQGAAYVKAIKDGYFLGSKTIFAQEAPSIANVRIKLLSNEIIGSVDATSGGEVTLVDGGKINFPPGSVADASGEIYSGQVNVAAKWLDPTADDLGEIMPGSLFGIDVEGQQRALATMGMMAVELYGSGGEKLNVAEGQEVELTFPVPADIVDAAAGMPTIPLWSFNEETGVWEEEGTAELIGDTYVGKVTHFSFWNCDAPFPLIEFKGSVVNTDGEPITNAWVTIKFPDACVSGHGTTDNLGCFGGKIPKDELLILIINFYNPCGDPYEAEIGPFSQNTTLAPIVLDLPGFVDYNISGSIVDCDGNAVSNAYAFVSVDNYGQPFFADDNGNFEGSLIRCEEGPISVIGYDLDNLKESLPATFPYAPTVNTGDLVACNDVEQYIIYDLDGSSFSIVGDLVNGGAEGDMYIQLYGDNQDSIQNISFFFVADMPGEYEIESFSANNIWSDTQQFPTGLNITTTLTDFPVVGDPFIGTFDGTFIDFQGNTHTVTGSYKVNRQY